MYWISVVVKLMVWIVVGVLGVMVYYRGLEQTVEDVGWVVGLWAGWESEGEKVGGRRARGKRMKAEAMDYGKRTPRGRTRGAGW